MRILAIDFGEKKVGIAFAETPLAEPYSVIRYKSETTLFENIKKIVEMENIEKVLIGLSEGKTAEKTKSFGQRLSEFLKLSVDFVDETLSTLEAQKLSREAGTQRKKRKNFEDAYAAAVFLQNYLDSI